MKKIVYFSIILSIILSACGKAPTANPTPSATETQTPSLPATPTLLPTETTSPTQVQVLSYPPDGYGPSNFPADVDPLTGLKVVDPALLQRRPMLIKISNMPRDVRPQWGLSLADIVFEYYSEAGMTRFAAIFYANDASIVGPIRSGRFIDAYLVDGYKAVYAFGGAYVAEMDRFNKSDFANRMVVEESYTPLTRYDPNGYNYLVVNSADLSAYITKRGVNGVQKLDNMLFKLEAPSAGQPGTQVYVHFSDSVYNRWDYDPASGKYLRSSDTVDITNGNQAEQYAPLTDRLNNQPIAYDNVVVLYIDHKVYSTDSNGESIYDIQLSGSGDAYAFRDGQAYQVKWQRKNADVVSLTNPDGSAFAFKPGTTWFEVVGLKSTLQQTDQSWRFTHQMP